MKLDNKEDLKALRAMLEQHLEQFSRETGFKVNIGSISYRVDGSQASTKIEISDLSKSDDHEAMEWGRLVRWNTGFKNEDLGQVIGIGGVGYRIAGYNPRARKACIKLVRVPDGKTFKAPEDTVLIALGRSTNRSAKTASSGK